MGTINALYFRHQLHNDRCSKVGLKRVSLEYGKDDFRTSPTETLGVFLHTWCLHCIYPVEHGYVSLVAGWPHTSFMHWMSRDVYPLDWCGGAEKWDFGGE